MYKRQLLGCTVVEKEGYEADDILGTLSAAAAEQGGACFIATGDRDALQLVGERVTVLLAATKMGRPETTLYDVPAIREKYGLEPAQLIDLKALMGDASDNIPGVPGVGEKTALDLLHRFGSLDDLYACLLYTSGRLCSGPFLGWGDGCPAGKAVQEKEITACLRTLAD